MNILSLFPAVPMLMMLGLWASRNTKQIHAVMVTGASLLLGLSIAQSICGEHRGKITASTDGRESNTFSVRLPLCRKGGD